MTYGGRIWASNFGADVLPQGYHYFWEVTIRIALKKVWSRGKHSLVHNPTTGNKRDQVALLTTGDPAFFDRRRSCSLTSCNYLVSFPIWRWKIYVFLGFALRCISSASYRFRWGHPLSRLDFFVGGLRSLVWLFPWGNPLSRLAFLGGIRFLVWLFPWGHPLSRLAFSLGASALSFGFFVGGIRSLVWFFRWGHPISRLVFSLGRRWPSWSCRPRP